MKSKKALFGLVAYLLAASLGLSFAKEKEKEDPNVRSVQGIVMAPDDSPAARAIVQLKDTKTHQVRSFITRQDGAYYFYGLSTNVDYQLRAERAGMVSPVRTLSVYDTRKKAIINLKLESKP
jgi:hypothetical protein